MGIRGYFLNLLLNSVGLFLLAIYEILISVFCKVGTCFLEMFFILTHLYYQKQFCWPIGFQH